MSSMFYAGEKLLYRLIENTLVNSVFPCMCQMFCQRAHALTLNGCPWILTWWPCYPGMPYLFVQMLKTILPSHGLEHETLLVWKLQEGAMSQGMPVVSGSWTRPENGFSHRSSRKKHSPANIWTITQRDTHQNFVLQNCKIKMCVILQLCLQTFALEATENNYKLNIPYLELLGFGPYMHIGNGISWE